MSQAIHQNTSCLALSCLTELAHLPAVRNITCGNPTRISRDGDCLYCHRLDTWLGIFTQMWLKSKFSKKSERSVGVPLESSFIVHSLQQSEILELSPVTTLYLFWTLTSEKGSCINNIPLKKDMWVIPSPAGFVSLEIVGPDLVVSPDVSILLGEGWSLTPGA